MDTSLHPCFDPDARHTSARVHLPVAPKCNVQCNFCNRKFDCLNESRPGVTSTVLRPWQAEQYFNDVLAGNPCTTVAGIAGPGDPFANAEATLETLRLVRKSHPDTLLCVATNGFGLPAHLDALAEIGVTHVTVTVNAVDPAIGQRIYAWVRDGTDIRRGRAAAELLWARQQEGIRGLVERGIAVKINSIAIPGENDDHIPAIAEAVAKLGATFFNCISLLPAGGTKFAGLPEVGPERLAGIREQCSRYLPQMTHCTRCRADAVGRLGEEMTFDRLITLRRYAQTNRHGTERTRVAVASLEGMLINQHLGEADELFIYAQDGDGFRQTEVRSTPPAGSGDSRWQALADILNDCRALLVSGVGPTPLKILEASGLRVCETDGLIDAHVTAVFSGQELRGYPRRAFSCGSSCKGDGMGCG